MRHICKAFASAAVATLALVLAPLTGHAGQGWDQIFLNGPIQATLPDGSQRTVNPSCSAGPVATPAGPRPADPQFSFFVRKGNPNKVILALDGGGACWNALTCIGTPLANQSTYSQTVNETPAALDQAGGLFDSSNTQNPYHEYTKVFVPYCTADVHWGSKDTTYVLPLGPGVNLPWTIRHRGAENLIAVLDWLSRNGRRYQLDFSRTHDVTVTGASAGGYGAMIAFAYFAEMTPRARHNLVSDAAIGALTQSFYQTAFFNSGAPGSEAWGVAPNLPPWVPGFAAILPAGEAAPNSLVPMAFERLWAYKPAARFASLTTNFDLTQIFFYAAMKGLAAPDAATAFEWYLLMKGITAATAAIPNYRFFIDDGSFHTFIGSDAATYGVGPNGISVADWIRNMIKPGNRVWDSLDAGPPSP